MLTLLICIKCACVYLFHTYFIQTKVASEINLCLKISYSTLGPASFQNCRHRVDFQAERSVGFMFCSLTFQLPSVHTFHACALFLSICSLPWCACLSQFLIISIKALNYLPRHTQTLTHISKVTTVICF